jgi:hypothetical protein
MSSTSKLSLAVTLFAVLVGGCRVFDSATDCHSICTRYQTCFDAEYDTGGCEKRCRDNANADSNYFRDVDTCNACISDRACAESVFSCGSNCTRVVP